MKAFCCLIWQVEKWQLRLSTLTKLRESKLDSLQGFLYETSLWNTCYYSTILQIEKLRKSQVTYPRLLEWPLAEPTVEVR